MKTFRALSFTLFIMIFLGVLIFSLEACKKEEDPVDNTPTNPELLLLIPTNFQLTENNIYQKRLSWDFNYTNITGFKIDRKVGDNSWVEGYLSVSKDQYYVIDELAPPDSSVVYQYRVYAWMGNSVSLYSILEANFNIPYPENFSIEKTGELSCRLSWTDKAIGEMGYKIDRKIGGNDWDNEIASLDADVTSYRDSIQIKSNDIKYRVYAYWDTLNSRKTEQECTSISAPTHISIQKIAYNKLELGWLDNSNVEDLYIIDRKIEDQNWEIQYGKVIANQTTYIDNDADCGADISYRIYSYVGNIASAYLEGSIYNNIHQPTGIIAEMPTLQKIDLEWNDNSSFEDGYIIDRKTGNNAWEDEYAILGPDAETFSDQDFPLNTNISYRVKAYAGTCLSSNISTSVNTDIPPPSDLMLDQLSNTKIELEWYDNSNGESGFKIDRKIADGNWEIAYAQVTANIKGYIDDDNLLHGETYYYRVYAFYDNYNSTATSNSETVVICGNPIKDPRDNITYNTTEIGTQCWMAGNLMHAVSNSWCYDNLSGNCVLYGRLYNWSAAMQGASHTNAVPSGVQGVCPEGWHIPSDAEWQILINYTGGESIAGKKLKSESGWENNGNGTDEYGFNGVAGGKRTWNWYDYQNKGYYGYYWTTTKLYEYSTYYRELGYQTDSFERFTNHPSSGFSVRCLRD